MHKNVLDYRGRVSIRKISLFLLIMCVFFLAIGDPGWPQPAPVGSGQPCSANSLPKELFANASRAYPIEVGNLRAGILNARLTTCYYALYAVRPDIAIGCAPRPGIDGRTDLRPIVDLIRLCALALPAPSPSASPYLHFFANSVVVLAQAADLPTNSRLTLEFVRQIQKAQAARQLMANSFVVAAPSWKLSDFLSQCDIDPGIRGAVILTPPATMNGVESYLLVSRSWTQIDASGFVVNCDRVDGLKGVARLDWAPNEVFVGSGSRNSGTLLPFAAVVTALKALRNPTSTTTTYVYATPNPLPTSTGIQTTVQTTSNVANNNLDLLLLASTNFFGQVGGATVASASAPDAQFGKATAQAMDSLVQGMFFACLIAQPTNKPKFCNW